MENNEKRVTRVKGMKFNENGELVEVNEDAETYNNIYSTVDSAEEEKTNAHPEQGHASYNDGNEDGNKKPKGKKRRVASFIAVALVAAMVGGLFGGLLVGNQLNKAINQNTQNYEAMKNGSMQKVSINLSDDVYYAQAVAEKAQKVVVGIATTQTVNTYFGRQTSEGMGSGIIVDSNGYILTNSHVIGDNKFDTITVSFIDGTTIAGEVKWHDASLDLAIVKVDKTGLPAAEIGDSDNLSIGEPVVAIGNPMTLDFERTVTDGIVSGLNRSITFDNGTTIKPLIQTNASINPGNSGGPLFNAKGEVIGINTAKMQSAEGLGFAIPINTAKPILDQMMNQGSISAVYVGITGVEIGIYEKTLNVDISAENGIVVIEALKNSPADKAGIKMGDIITGIDGKKIEDMSDLKKQLYNYKPGDKAKLAIERSNEEMTVELTFMEKPADTQ